MGAPHGSSGLLTRKHMSFQYFTSLLLGFAVLNLSGCSEEPSGTSMVVSDSSGVVMVSNPSGDIPLGWTAEKVLEISPLDDGEEGFFGVTDLGVVNGDRIAVLDGDGKKVVLFDDQGSFLSQYGRQGSGPGEFQYPLDLVPDPAGGLLVYDMMNGRLERFDSTLSPLAPDPLQLPYFGGHMAFAGPFLVMPIRELANPEVEDQTLTAIREPDTISIIRHVRAQGGSITLESCGMGLSGITPLFSPRTFWAAGPDGMIAVVGQSWYEVDIYREPGFELERRIRRDVAPVPTTEAMAEAEVGDGMRVMTSVGERVCDAAEVVEKRGFASEAAPISKLTISPDGEIFVERWAPRGEERAIDVLSSEGEYLGTLAPGFPFPEAFLGGDRIIVSEEDDLELSSVVVYRMVK